jgi:hypothetical protein
MSNRAMMFLGRYGLTLLIALAILSIVGVVLWETGGFRYLSPGLPKLDGAARKADEIALLPAFTLPPVDPTFKETVERPLFNQSRRPNPPAPPAEAAKPTMEKGKYRLTGTSVHAELSTAFLVDNRTGKTLRVARGAVVDPLGPQQVRLESVSPTSAVLKLGDDSETLTLLTSKSPPPQMVAQTMPQSSAPIQAGSQPPMLQPPAPGQLAVTPGAALPPAQAGSSLPVPIPQPVAQQQPQQNIYGPGGPFATGSLAPGASPQTPSSAAPPTPADQATALRRRRFQNLPQ